MKLKLKQNIGMSVDIAAPHSTKIKQNKVIEYNNRNIKQSNGK